MTSERDQAIVDNLRLVHHVVGKSQRWVQAGYTYGDAVSAGVIGLIKALDNYRPETGCAFSSFACACILNEIKADAARFHGIGFRQALQAGEFAPAPLSLDAPAYGGDEPATWLDLLADQDQGSEPEPIYPPELVEALAALNEKDRIAVLNHEALAADLLGVSLATAQRRRFRAYVKARKALGVAS